jgi:hypothetical protein
MKSHEEFDLLEVIFCTALHFLSLNSLWVLLFWLGWTWVFSLSLSLVLLFPLCWVLCLMEFFRVSSPSKAFFFGPSFPPLLGALFNGVFQGFITFKSFFLWSFFSPFVGCFV